MSKLRFAEQNLHEQQYHYQCFHNHVFLNTKIILGVIRQYIHMCPSVSYWWTTCQLVSNWSSISGNGGNRAAYLTSFRRFFSQNP